MTKSPDAFRTISEVADWLGIQAHVLRFWESKFSQVKPVKRAGGRRYYRPSDMQLLGGIKKLLYEDGLTIKGVQKILREQGVNPVAEMSAPLNEGAIVAASDDTEIQKAPDDKAADAPMEATSVPAEVAEEVAENVSDAIAPEPEQSGEEEQEQLPLPSFRHQNVEARAQEDAPDQPQETPAPIPPDESATPPEQLSALVVDAPDPPDDADIPYNPGVLADLVKFDRLGTEKAAAAKPLIEALDDWLVKVSGAA